MKEIILPIESPGLEQESPPYHMFRHRLDGLGTFIGEVLLAADLFTQKYAYKDESEIRLQPNLFLNDFPEEERLPIIALREKHGRSQEIMQQTDWFHEHPVPAPELIWQPRKERRNLSGALLQGLFFTAITQLVSIYEIYIVDIAGMVYHTNPSLLAIDEYQLKSSEIIQFATYDKVIESLIDRAINKLIYNVSYPNLVERFHKIFHVGIHDRGAPIKTLFPVHHLIEKRNIIVHNNGEASAIYLEKMSAYTGESILEVDGEIPVDFVGFYDDLIMIREVGTYIEQCIQKQWPNLGYWTYKASSVPE